MDDKKTTAVAGTTAGIETKREFGSTHSPYDYDYTTERDFCQALTKEIEESALAIAETPSDPDNAAFHAGRIQALNMALRLALKGVPNG